MADRQLKRRVEHLKEVIYELYGDRHLKSPYIRGRPLRDVKVRYYDSKDKWDTAHKRYAETYARKLVRYWKQNNAPYYQKRLHECGTHEGVVAAAKNTYLQAFSSDDPAYYDSISKTIVTRSKSHQVLGHELVHACAVTSGVNLYGLPVSRFSELVDSKLTESVVEYLSYEISFRYITRDFPEGPKGDVAKIEKEYIAKRLTENSKDENSSDGYSLTPAKQFINTHGREKVLHSYFSGSFEKANKGTRHRWLKTGDDGRQWVPAIPSTGKRTKLRRPLQRRSTGYRRKTATRTTPVERLPTPTARQGRFSREYTTIAPKSYTVKPGDTFPTVAKKFGAANQWQTLKTHNPHVGGAKHTPLPTGRKLTLPAHWSSGRARWWDGASTRRTGATSGGFAHQYDRSVGTRFDRRRDRRVGRGIGTGRGLTVEPNWMKPHQYRTVSLEPKSRPFTTSGGFDARTGGSLDGYRASDGLGPSGRVQPKKYTIKPNDTLSGIASKFGHASQWRTLYNLNRKTIGNNPHLIHPTQTLDIPAHWRYGGSY
ncbi:LysM peptidoglycan-binding domain-containing protein [Salinigranum halophilum]|uniref:LysM peptidoglycan-binding domain-containing protein n=1 Tax=Salinigranum halophilum TaxID=2565931 RepID=UPI00115F6083|nr:LysM domain-containing protein [Salinigranum halophilum]